MKSQILPCLALVVLVGCMAPGRTKEPMPVSLPGYAIAIHGGAGVIPRDRDPAEIQAYREALSTALEVGRRILDEGGTALDAVQRTVLFLEDHELFNAGKGAVFTSEGTHELDAAVMDGSTLNCGAVSGVKTIKNPIALARLVMEKSRHVFLVGDGAEHFAREMQLEQVEQEYFSTRRRYEQWQKKVQAEKAGQTSSGFGTVGAVALDRDGHLAAATSTGGLTNKRFGRVGDVPIIGAGTYASDRTCAVSCTGIGEQFIRNTVARDVAALMEYRGLDLEEAARLVIHERLKPEDGGLIAVSREGRIALVYNSGGMLRGAADSEGRFEVNIWNDE